MARSSSDLTEFHRIRRHLAIAVSALLVITAVGVVGFALIGGDEHTLLDALYMTVITLTTVGYGEIVDMSASPAGRIFTILLLLVGMTVVLYAVPMVAAFVIEGRLFHAFERRRMEKTIAKMTSHYIVCGERVVVAHVAGELASTGHEVVSVISDLTEGTAELLPGVPSIVGDPTDDATLVEAGIGRATGVIMTMGADRDNVLGVFTARRLNTNVRIVAAAEGSETGAKLRAAGADAVVSPTRVGGLRMASEMVRPTVVTFLDKMLRSEDGSLRVEEVQMAPADKGAGMTLGSLEIGETAGVVVLAIRDPKTGSFQFKPSSDTEIQPDMTLIVMADKEGRGRLKRRMESARVSTTTLSIQQ